MFDRAIDPAGLTAVPVPEAPPRRPGALSAALGRLVATARGTAARRELVSALARLDDRLLDDVGLTRADLRRALGDAGPDA